MNMKKWLTRWIIITLVLIKTMAPVVVEVSGEVSPIVLGSTDVVPDEITDDYQKETVRQIMDFKGLEPVPIPTERVRLIFENWEEATFGPFRQELKGLGAEDEKRIKFGAKCLYAYENSGKLEAYGANDDKFQNHLSRKEIIDYVLTGKNDDVFIDKDGSMVWLVTADKKAAKKIKQGFKDAVELFAKNGIIDVIESCTNNGFCILFCSLTQPEWGTGQTYLDESGVIWQNLDSKNVNTIKLGNLETRNLLVEPYGIRYLQYIRSLTYRYELGDFYGNCEVVKDTIASVVALSLNDKNGLYRIFGESFKVSSDNFAKNFSISEAAGKRQIELMADFIDPIGYDSLRDIEEFNILISPIKK